MDLKYEFYIAGSPEQVWEALISPEGTKKTYYGSVIRSSFEVGSPMEYVGPGKEGEKTVHIYGKVLEFKPYAVFAHTYNVGRAYAGDDSRYAESRITYSLEPIGACTKLKVVHDQWRQGDPSYENTANGWWLLLSNIKTLVETGKALDLQGAAGHTGSGPEG